MNPDKPPSQIKWSAKASAVTLIGFIVLVLPTVRLALGSHHWISQYVLDIYMTFVLTSLLLVRKITFRDLGVSVQSLRQNCILGLGVGGAILICLPILDFAIEATELSKVGLFSNKPKTPISIPPLTQIAGVVCHSVLDQMFFFGLISQTWLKKSNPYLIIYLTGIIFAIAHAQLTVGVFAMGLIGCLLYHLTGTLIASTIFQLACLSSGFLLKASYPRLVTLLGFLF